MILFTWSIQPTAFFSMANILARHDYLPEFEIRKEGAKARGELESQQLENFPRVEFKAMTESRRGLEVFTPSVLLVVARLRPFPDVAARAIENLESRCRSASRAMDTLCLLVDSEWSFVSEVKRAEVSVWGRSSFRRMGITAISCDRGGWVFGVWLKFELIVIDRARQRMRGDLGLILMCIEIIHGGSGGRVLMLAFTSNAGFTGEPPVSGDAESPRSRPRQTFSPRCLPCLFAQ